jgi:hypothetical protein
MSNGEPVLFMDDVFPVVGCVLNSLSCTTVQWATGNYTFTDNGVPALDTSSVGICMGAGGVPNGPVIIATHSLDYR